MSTVIRFGWLARSPTQAPAVTPPAGPDSSALTANRPASPADCTAPFDCMTKSSPVNPLLRRRPAR